MNNFFVKFFVIGSSVLFLGSCATLGGSANRSVIAYFTEPEFSSEIKARNVQKGQAVFSQPVYLGPTATLKADVTSLQGEVVKREIRKGSVLFNAASPKGTIYCSSATDPTNNIKQYSHFDSDMFCFLDADKDNSFDEYFSIPGGTSGFPVFTTHRTPWSQLTEKISYTHNGKGSKFPLEMRLFITLESVRIDKREISVSRELGTMNSKEPVADRQKFSVGPDGYVNIDGAELVITDFQKDSISVELRKPPPARAFTLQQSPSRTFYVPG